MNLGWMRHEPSRSSIHCISLSTRLGFSCLPHHIIYSPPERHSTNLHESTVCSRPSTTVVLRTMVWHAEHMRVSYKRFCLLPSAESLSSFEGEPFCVLLYNIDENRCVVNIICGENGFNL